MRAGQPNPSHPKKKRLWVNAVSVDPASADGAAAGRGPWPCWMAVAAVLVGAGWGSNQFTPMLLVYRHALGLSAGALEAMFGVYALGLIPGLFLAGPLSDARGRRLPVLGAAATSLVGSLLLIAGSRSPALLYVARFVVGLGSGAAFSAGTAWLRELSLLPPGNADSTRAARRAAVAMTTGFAVGPLVSGLLAQWGPEARFCRICLMWRSWSRHYPHRPGSRPRRSHGERSCRSAPGFRPGGRDGVSGGRWR